MGMSLLLMHHKRTADAKSLEMVEGTVKAMKHGGIYDQLGGGLSRYSTDHRWLVPHFEKMLYDNALLVTTMIETFQVTGNREYAEFANDILQYIDRDMTSPEGGFYSAEDADSEGVEGKFYVWTQEEIEKVLGRKTASIAIPYYNVSPNGNWEGNNVLHVTRSPSELAKELNFPESTVLEELASARTKLLEYRSQRIRPLLDDKILTSWNGLMISAMAKAGRVLEDTHRIEQAEKALSFVLDKLRTPEGKLLRRYREGDARYDGNLFDYTSIAVSALDLYEATDATKYLELARELMDRVETHFATGEGAYYETPADGETLIIRQISGYDGVEPSGNSNAANALLRLSAYYLEPEYEKRAEAVFLTFHDEIMEYGINSSAMMQAFHLYLAGMKEVAVVGPRNDPSTSAMRKMIRSGFYPNAVVAFAYEDEIESLSKEIPLLAGKKPVDGKCTAYVCRRGACLAPVTSVEELSSLLGYND